MKESITIRIEKDLLDYIRNIADQKNRAISNFMETIMIEHFDFYVYCPNCKKLTTNIGELEGGKAQWKIECKHCRHEWTHAK